MENANKQRLRPWLEGHLNSGEIAGVRWLNEEKTKFRIPWKHGGKQSWTEESSRIFMEWAKHTGRYREGIDPPDHVKWKTRLRCAFNKAPDIEELKDESVLDDTTDPHRVYLLKPRKIGKQASRAATVKPEPSDFSGESSAQRYEGAPPIPTIVEDYKAESTESMSSLPQDLRDVPCDDIHVFANTNYASYLENEINMMSDRMESFGISEQPSTTSTPQDHNMFVKVFYAGEEVLPEKHVEKSGGCRIYYGALGEIPIPTNLPRFMEESIYTWQTSLDPLCFPPCYNLMGSRELNSFWQTFLERGFQGGVILKCHNDDIYAYRLSPCNVFYATYPDYLPKPLPREGDAVANCSSPVTKIFDYQKFSDDLVQRMITGEPLPDPNVYIYFCEKQFNELNQTSVIFASVVTERARNDVNPDKDDGLQADDDFIERLLQESEGAGPNFAGPNFAGPNFAGPNFAVTGPNFTVAGPNFTGPNYTTEATNVNIQTADANAEMTNVNSQLTNFNVQTIDPNEFILPCFSADLDLYTSLGFSEQDTEMILSWDN